MSEPVDLNMQAGEPYARRIRLTDGKTTWATLGDFEIRAQVRAGRNTTAPLKADLGPHLTPSYDANDIVIDLSLTGAETRAQAGGYYDLFISDPGADDARAIRLLHGVVRVTAAITDAEDVA